MNVHTIVDEIAFTKIVKQSMHLLYKDGMYVLRYENFLKVAERKKCLNNYCIVCVHY